MELQTGEKRLLDVKRGLYLHARDDGIYLCGMGLSVRADFTPLIPRLKPGRLQQELLVKAARLKHISTPCAIDATAGFGEDALLLAAAGFSVTLFERNPAVALLLRDALQRASQIDALREPIGRMTLVETDSIEALVPPLQADLIFLDPMFPPHNKHAATNKKLQLLRALNETQGDETTLLHAAWALRPRKLVVKRPLHGNVLGDIRPSYTLCGTTIRYDVIVSPGQTKLQ